MVEAPVDAMKLRSLVAAVAVLLILGGFLWWSSTHKSAAHKGPTTPALVTLNRKSITGLTLEAQGAPSIVLSRSGASGWQITSPAQFPASSTTVGTMLSDLSGLHAERVIEQKQANLESYGLSHPAFRIAIAGKDSHTTTLSFGDKTPTGDAVYVTVSGDPRVFTAGNWLRAGLDKSLEDLRDKRLMPVKAAGVTRFDLIHRGETTEFARASGGWQIEKPKAYRTDTFQVDDLLDQVTGAKWQADTVPAQAAAAFDHGQPVGTVKLIDGDGTQTLDVREDHDTYYAKSTAVPGAWNVTPALGEAVARTLDSFRNKQLFDFAYAEPDKIEVHSGSKMLYLVHQGKDWYSGGVKMSSGSVEDLVSAMRALAATKFVSSGFTNPGIRLVVTSNEGKQVETVALQKTKDGAIAKRADGPSLYLIDSDTFDLLTNAISGVKPAKADAAAKK